MGKPRDTSQQPSGEVDFSPALGRTIQVLRTDQGLSRADLAKRAGISYSYLSAIENGAKPPSTKILTVLAGALGIRVHELLAATDARMRRSEARDRPWQEAKEADQALERHDRKEWERQSRDRGYDAGTTAAMSFARTPDDPSPSNEPSRTEVGTLAELQQLLPHMSEADIAFLLEMARRLADRG
jgi:transcriptional regulator with XRE-family HTH domain